MAGAGAGVVGSDVVAGGVVVPSDGLLSQAAKVNAATATNGRKNLSFIMSPPDEFRPFA